MLTALFSFHGKKFRASVFALHEAELVFEVYSGGGDIQLGIQLQDVFLFHFNERIATLTLSITNVSEISPDCTSVVGWIKKRHVEQIEIFNQNLATNEVLAKAKEIASQADLQSQTLPEFRLAIVDVLDKLEAFRDGLALSKIGLSCNATAALRKSAIMCSIEKEFSRFEKAAQRVPPHLISLHRSYAHRKLRGVLMESELLRRILNKPRAYPGDFETIKILLKMMSTKEQTLFGDILTRWALQQDPALAHNNRIDLLASHLELEIQRALSGPAERIAILNVGCGPAKEIFKLRGGYAKPVDITVVDFDEGAIGDLTYRAKKARFAEKNIHLIPCCVNVSLFRKSIGRGGVKDKYDFVYCAGLIDYRSDPSARSIVGSLLRCLKPNGLAIFTNVSRKNPYHYFMSWVLDWELEERNEEELKGLVNQVQDFSIESINVVPEQTGVNFFLLVRSRADHVISTTVRRAAA